MTWNAVIYAGAAIGSAVIGKKGADSAANKQKKWRHRAIDLQERQYEEAREDFAPWRDTGRNALARIEDPNAFQADPGYEFRRSEGLRGIDQRYGARGGGGNAMRALAEFNQNLASNEYGNWFNRQTTLAGLGNAATSGTANVGMNFANNAGMQFGAIGNAMAQGTSDAYAGINNALISGLSNYLYSRPKGVTTWVPRSA